MLFMTDIYSLIPLIVQNFVIALISQLHTFQTRDEWIPEAEELTPVEIFEQNFERTRSRLFCLNKNRKANEATSLF